jgi:hypothetical protein
VRENVKRYCLWNDWTNIGDRIEDYPYILIRAHRKIERDELAEEKVKKYSILA